MSQERMQELERRIANMERLMQGKIEDGLEGGGVIGCMKRISETVYGSRDMGDGLVQSVSRLTRVMWIGMGFMVAINVGWLLFTHFHK